MRQWIRLLLLPSGFSQVHHKSGCVHSRYQAQSLRLTYAILLFNSYKGLKAFILFYFHGKSFSIFPGAEFTYPNLIEGSLFFRFRERHGCLVPLLLQFLLKGVSISRILKGAYLNGIECWSRFLALWRFPNCLTLGPCRLKISSC